LKSDELYLKSRKGKGFPFPCAEYWIVKKSDKQINSIQNVIGFLGDKVFDRKHTKEMILRICRKI